MAITTSDYKGITVLDAPNPVGSGGDLIQDNFKELADRVGPCNKAAADPTVNDDSGDGYEVNSRWINTTSDQEFVCMDNTLGAAVWKQTTPAIATTQTLTIPLAAFSVVSDLSMLPAAGDGTSPALIPGTFGTDTPSIQTSDFKAAGPSTETARLLLSVPRDFVAGTAKLILHAGMDTTISDTTATIDVEAYVSDEEAGKTADGDICETAATTINSLTLGDKEFTLDDDDISAGSLMDIRITFAINDAATGTAVIGILGAAKFTYQG